MLIEFKIKNLYSLQDEQTLSLVCGDTQEHKSNIFSRAQNKLLKSVGIYGANASGKSNVIKALKTMQDIVLTSADKQEGDILPILPFLLGKEEKKPSLLEVSFMVEDTLYTYGFEATQEKIIREYLFSSHKEGEKQEWFSRTYNAKQNKYDYQLHPHLHSSEDMRKLWQDATRDNALFLSTATKLNSKKLAPIFDWFKKINIKGATKNFGNGLEITLDIFKENPKTILKYLKTADLDIENLHTEERQLSLQVPKSIKKITKTTQTIHLNQDNQPIAFDISLESDGTQEFLALLGPIIDTLEKGQILVIDEINNHLHPLMTKFIIHLFHKNITNAQLIFTTHETSILDKDFFRKDQIYFCEKQNKATTLYSMHDFKELSEKMDYEKSYLLGRFGALPFINA
ncbi:ATP-binding protein [Helicobacter sp.]|uniref:AAA family ATPase n=1 Tax=Helicobacter sp. TaxID=218 RepID=UPI002A74CC37|nr:ATP-binding protein [Helicobacter sp.]MDY2585702.1 ATP-binding protein [Helicobacter sp.]